MRSPSRTVPETADTAIMLIRFCATIDNVDAAAGGGFAFDVLLASLRFAFCGVVFAAIAFPGDGGSGALGGLTLTLSLSEFVPDLQSPWHAVGRESLSGLVNQS
jgi:hypothetical protein